MPISEPQRRFLRAKAHGLSPLVQIGQAGITPSVCDAIRQALYDHELIKIKFGQSYPGQAREDASQLALDVQAELCQVIGRVAVLYRPRGEVAKGKPVIELPRA